MRTDYGKIESSGNEMFVILKVKRMILQLTSNSNNRVIAVIEMINHLNQGWTTS